MHPCEGLVRLTAVKELSERKGQGTRATEVPVSAFVISQTCEGGEGAVESPPRAHARHSHREHRAPPRVLASIYYCVKTTFFKR